MRWIPTVIVLATAFAADRRPVPWEKNQLQAGQALYRENCVVCHDIDQQQSKVDVSDDEVRIHAHRFLELRTHARLHERGVRSNIRRCRQSEFAPARSRRLRPDPP